MLAHIECLLPVNDIYCFLRSLFAKRNRSWNWVSVQWKANSRLFGRFYLLCVSTSKRSPKRMQLSLIVRITFGFWLISDLPISEWSGFPHFQFSINPRFNISGLRVNLHLTLRAGWIEGLLEVVALKSQFSDPNWDLPSWFSDSRANFHLWTVFLPSYLARNVTQFHLFWALDCFFCCCCFFSVIYFAHKQWEYITFSIHYR